MKLFSKEPDMICWNCQELISHKKVNWKPRKVAWKDPNPVMSSIMTDLIRQAERQEGNKDAIASPNRVFGVYEYEYRGFCPLCNEEQCLFWFGKESIKRNKKPVEPKEPFLCHECKHPIQRENPVWYSYRVQEIKEVKEYLVCLCPECQTENGYPFGYDLEAGIIN